MAKPAKKSWPDKRPVVCLVTDRHRLAGTVGSDDVSALEKLVAESVRAGIDLVQIRELGLSDRLLTAVVSRAVTVAQGSRTRIVVNDRVDIAVTAGANGVHLKETSMPAERARTIVPESCLIGRSVHSVAEAERANGGGAIDYLVAGTVFSTRSKPGCKLIGLEGLRAVVSAVDIPVIAIGGMSVMRTREIAETGAAGLAAFDEFALPGRNLSEVVNGFRHEFDRAGGKLL